MKKITDFEVGERLDKVLAEALPKYSRATLAKLIASGRATVNGRVKKASYKLKPDDKVQIDLESDFKIRGLEANIPILYESDNLIVLDKPAGVLTHSKGAFNPEGTVATWLWAHINSTKPSHMDAALGASEERTSRTNSTVSERENVSDNALRHEPAGATGSASRQGKAVRRFGIVHRLDRATSGVIICAKDEATQKFLQKQFSSRKVKKTYLALVEGELEHKEAVIDMPIERNPKKPATFRVGTNGKSAQTAYKVLQTDGKTSLLELKPTTGRTHQLRVHLHKIGHPIIGDTLYGGKTTPRMMLHAYKLEVTLPDSQRKVFTAKKPAGFEVEQP